MISGAHARTVREPLEVRMSKAKQTSIRIAARTDVGLVREHNEDNFVLADLTNGERESRAIRRVGPAGVLLGVCDGMGGAAAGEVASRIASRVLIDEMTRVQVTLSDKQFSKALQRAVEIAGEAIQEDAKHHVERKGMGTTCTAVAVRGDRAFIAQVGDSRAYLLRQGVLSLLTKDQTLAHALLERGHLSEEELANYSGSNPVLQALGATEDIGVEMTEVVLEPSDRLLVCSDGLHGLVDDETIRKVLGAKIEAACTELVQLAKAAGGRDNITVVVADVDSPYLTRASGFPSVLSAEQTSGGDVATAVLQVPMTFGRRHLLALGALLLVVFVGSMVGLQYARSSAASRPDHTSAVPTRAPRSEPSHAKPPEVDLVPPPMPAPPAVVSVEDAATGIPSEKPESTPTQRKPITLPKPTKRNEPRVVTLPSKPEQELVPATEPTPEEQKKWVEQGDPFASPFP